MTTVFPVVSALNLFKSAEICNKRLLLRPLGFFFVYAPIIYIILVYDFKLKRLPLYADEDHIRQVRNLRI